MDISLLGDLELRDGDASLDIAVRPARAVLVVLALHAGHAVSTADLIDAVWGEHPPASATKTLQSHISQLRRILPAGLVETMKGGYRLRLRPDEVDALRLGALVDDARRARSEGDDQLAAALLDDAVSLWRSTPLADLADGPFRAGRLAQLEAEYGSAVEERAAARLAVGDHERMIPQLELLVAEHPYREPLWGDLMLALYRSGRRVDALAAYERLRRVLRDDLGVSPSAPLRDLAARIVNEDPTLQLQPVRPASNLPAPLTSFIGRADQLREVPELLLAHRLVTLVGPGGVGKTRLAIEVVRSMSAGSSTPWPDGVVFVDLTGMDDVGDAVAGVREQLLESDGASMSDGEGTDALAAALSDRTLLLVLDRAEALAGPLSDVLAKVLEQAPGVTALVTSRVPLTVPGEWRYDVPTLGLPDPVTTGDLDRGQSESVELFLERTRDEQIRHDPGELAAVAELCRSVDGLPLAIELLAARVGALSASALVAELRNDPRLALGSTRGDSVDTHASLEAVLDSSARLLTDEQRRALGRLTVFRGSFDLAAVRSLGVDVLGELERLIDIGLVVPGDRASSERRFRLTDSTRTYAERFLGEDEAAAVARAHARHYAAFVRRAGAGLSGPDRPRWMRRIGREAANLRAALSWLLDHDPPAATAFSRAVAKEQYVWVDHAEALRLLTRLVEVAQHDAGTAPVYLAWTLLGVGWPRFLTGDVTGGMAALEQAADLFLGADEHLGASEALVGRGHMELLGSADAGRAAGWYRRALDEANTVDDPQTRALVLVEAAQSLILTDLLDERVETMLEQAEQPLRAAHDHQRLAHLSLDRMLAAYALGDLEGVARFADLAIAEDRLARARMFTQIAHVGHGVSKLHLGDLAGALPHLRTGIRMADDDHNALQLGIALQALAVHHVLAGRERKAARVWGAARSAAPLWPLFDRRYGSLIGRDRLARLEEAFESDMAAGTVPAIGEVVEQALAFSPTAGR